MSREDSTLLNVTPARHTVPILMLNGYKRLCSGVFAAIPTLSPPILRARVAPYTADLRPGEGLTAFEVQVLRDHADYGCSSVICTDEGQQYPFVFSPRRWVSWKGVPIGAVTLSYCRSVDDFVRFAGPLGRHLAKRAVALVFIDANGPIPNLRGRYLAWGPKFYRGPKPPRLGDLAYTELVMFSMRRALLD